MFLFAIWVSLGYRWDELSLIVASGGCVCGLWIEAGIVIVASAI